MVLKITEAEAKYAKLLVVDRLPAGLEIDNPALFDSGSTDAFSWLKRDIEPAHVEYRDDRFVAAMDRDERPIGVLLARLCRARDDARPLCLSARRRRRTCIGPSASAARRSARSR